ncbi:MAG: thioredoxin family protein, partial [Eggerthellaceae bacterium]|nr:thioredoxin family protein [Eggerthellaceae bacterium]
AAAATEMERHLAAMQEKTGLIPERPKREEPSPEPKAEREVAPSQDTALFSADVVAQLNTVFARMANPVVIKLALDDRPVSAELRAYMEGISDLTDKVSVRVMDAAELEAAGEGAAAPCAIVCAADGTPTGLAFHGVPGGHEFTSFVLGLYNAAGPGQPIDEATKAEACAIDRPVKMQVLVSLSCTMCPETVVAAQRIAALNPMVSAHVYDVNHFPEIKDRYNVMSVPCLVVNDGEAVSFGKKNIQDVLAVLG